jgi:hypothetical protein
MKKILRKSMALYIFVAVTVVAAGCAGPKTITKADKFPLMYEEKPLTILILPPMNESTAADAKAYYATTIQEVVSYWGYYVLPYEVTSDFLKMQGIYDSELIHNVPLGKFREYFGADAVLFTTIKKWNLTYMVLAANLTVSIAEELKSTKTNQTLWTYTGTVVVDLSGGNTGGGLAGLIAKAIVTAASSAMADYVPYARQANYRALATFPFGKYHPDYMKDQKMQFIDLTPEKSKK